MKAFCVNVVVTGASGGSMPSAMSFCDDQKVADAEAHRLQDKIVSIFEAGKITISTPAGPRVVCTAKDLLAMLGVVGVAHIITSGEMKGSIALPSNGIILPGN